MANTKEYSIKINGLTESINAVDSLNKQLDKLEQRMNALSSAKVTTGGGSSSRGNVSTLSEEERVQKEINKLKEQGAQLDAKIAASQDEIYKRVDATKQLLKETVADQKALAAQERLTADAYSNTMQGMKAKLADIKAVINTTDLGDTERIEQMTKDANDLTNKLKEMEQAYGQYGRNVGNYANGVAEGLQKVKITVGDTVREFGSAREASRTLNNELKSMAVNGEQDTEAFKQLQQVVMELDSNIADAKKPMDALMDSMEGVMAVANVGQGVRALFGVDDTEIQKSIQNLVALQNILKGIETINKQIKTGEGIGGWIRPFTTQVDGAIAKLVTLQTTMKATTVASKAMVIGLKAATVALKAFKAALSLGITIAIDLAIEKALELVETLKEGDKEFESANKVQEEGAKAYAEAAAKIALYKQRVESFNGTKKQEKKLVEEFNKDLGEGLGTYKSISEVQKALIEKSDAYCEALKKEAEAQALLNLYTEAFVNLQRVRMANAAGENDSWWRTKAGDMQHREELENEALKKSNDAWDAYLAKRKQIEQHNKDNKLFDYSDQVNKGGKATKDAVAEVEKEIAQIRLSAMKEGLNKTITQLEEERKQRLAKLKTNTSMYKKYEKEINDIYDKKIYDAKEAWAKKTEKLYEDLWDKIYADSLRNAQRVAALMSTSLENGRESMNNGYNKIFNQSIASYGVQGKRQLTSGTQKSLGLTSSTDRSKFMQDMRAEIDLMRQAQAAENEYMAALREYEREKENLSNAELGRLNLELDQLENNYNKRTRILDEYRDKMSELYDQGAMDKAKEMLFNDGYAGDLSTLFKQRISAVEAYWQERISFETSAITASAMAQRQVIEEQYSADTRSALAHWNEMQRLSDEHYKEEVEGIRAQENKKLITHEEAERQLREVEAKYNRENTQIFENYKMEEKVITAQYNADLIKLENDKNNQIKALNAESYQGRLQELRDFQTAISNLENKQPVMTKLGFTNLSETYKNNKEILDSYEEMAKKILDIRNDINRQNSQGLIDKDVYESTIRELDNFSSDLGEKMDEIKSKMSFTAQAQVLVGEIAQYAQQLGSSLNSMLQAFSDYTDQQYENTINELEKEIDKQKELYDKQEDIANEHKNKLNEIEDELATARGDRRQHLIDQLNAEMAAQRKAVQEQQKALKEQQRLEKQKDREEKKRKQDQKKMAMTQAVINGATAFMNALAQQPIWLGIAMAAMTAAMTAVQIATISSAKYAEGGVIQGRSHAQGGVKVLGGQAEVEGGEYITNKTTTSQNVELLSFINNKKRKLNIDDFIEFYSNGKTRKNISSMSPGRKFADGGVMPSLRSDISVNDRLLTAFEDYSNRPVQVAVVDINNRQAQVKNVQVMAGLTE